MSAETLEAARRYVAAGLSVIPVRRWSKQLDYRALGHPANMPLTVTLERELWKPYTRRLPDDSELTWWFGNYDCGLAIVGGAVSGGLVRLDFEHSACLGTWYGLLSEDRALITAASSLPIVQTPKGHHIYFRMADPPGHVILCSRGEGDSRIVFSETQGEGCYCLAPPTTGFRLDGTEAPYLWCSTTGPEAIPTLDQELASKLIEAARFPGFWEPTYAAQYGARTGLVSRDGLLLQEPGQHGPRLWLGWEHLTALRAYFDTYGSLLHAVETAPPPPPSYNEVDDDGDDDGVF